MARRRDDFGHAATCGRRLREQNHAVYRLKRSGSRRQGLGWFDRRLGYVGWRTFA